MIYKPGSHGREIVIICGLYGMRTVWSVECVVGGLMICELFGLRTVCFAYCLVCGPYGPPYGLTDSVYLSFPIIWKPGWHGLKIVIVCRLCGLRTVWFADCMICGLLGLRTVGSWAVWSAYCMVCRLNGHFTPNSQALDKLSWLSYRHKRVILRTRIGCCIRIRIRSYYT